VLTLQKYTTESVERILLQEGYVLLSNYLGARTKLKIKCPQGHDWSSTWNDWQQSHRCGFCSKRYNVNTAIVRCALQEKGFELIGEYKNANTPISVKCTNGHITIFRWHRWVKKPTCTECGKRPTITYNGICATLGSEGYVVLSKEYLNAQTHLDVQCPKQHKYPVTWTNWQQGHRCPVCSPGKASVAEKEIVEIFKGYCPIENNRSVLSGKELDIYFPIQKVAIEYCGLFWHSTASPRGNVDSRYHRNKMDGCNNQNIRLLTIFEDEWLTNKEICTSRINSALGIVQSRVFARKCVARQILNQEAYEFLKRTHLQGPGTCKVAYGLFYNNQLVQVMTFGSPTRAHTAKGKRVLEMKRLAGELNTIIVGGASKLFKLGFQYAKQNNFDVIKSYCDLRWGTGNLYAKLGFTKSYETKYTLHYVDTNQHRYRNQNLATNKQKEKVTENEKAAQKRLYKIYDCGHQTWEYRVKEVLRDTTSAIH